MRTINSDLRRFAFALVLAGTFVTNVAYADDDAKARDLFIKGRNLAKDGRCAEALAPFQESLKYAEGVGTLLNLGNCYETLGKTASAHRSFLRASDLASKNDDKRGAEAKERAKSIEKDVSSLLVHVPINMKSSAEIRVDGELWPKERWDVPWPIDPGVHDIEVFAPPRPKQTDSLTVKPHGDKVDWAVVAKDPATSPVPPPKSERLKEGGSDATGESSTQRTLGFVSMGAGGVGVLGGLVSGIISLSAHSAMTERCPTYPNNCNGPDPDLDTMNKNARLSGNISTISFIVGAVLLGVGAGLFFTSDSPKKTR